MNVNYDDYKFALGVVEGKPVFEGDELYGYGGVKFTVPSEWKHHDTEQFKCSWNPPKPKTIMIELLVYDVELIARLSHTGDNVSIFENVTEACRKALDSLK